MVGGNGNDTYVVNHVNDVVTETSSSGGTDLINSYVSYTASNYVENLTLIGAGRVNATGNNLNNTLNGNNKNNTLNGESGNDTIYGHNGNDTSKWWR